MSVSGKDKYDDQKDDRKGSVASSAGSLPERIVAMIAKVSCSPDRSSIQRAAAFGAEISPIEEIAHNGFIRGGWLQREHSKDRSSCKAILQSAGHISEMADMISTGKVASYQFPVSRKYFLFIMEK